MDLLNLRLTSTYFQYNGKHHKRLWAHQFPLLLQKLLCKTSRNKPFRPTLPLWLCYVDDTFTAVHKDEIDTFHEHLNRQNPHIQFTKDIEENGKIPFLDCLVSRDENNCYGPPFTENRHTLTDYSTNHPTTLLLTKPRLVCDSTDSLTDETNYLNNFFSKNNYNADFVRRNTYKPAEHNATNANPTPVTTATIPYIKGTSETIADTTTLQYPCCSQTHYDFATATNQR